MLPSVTVAMLDESLDKMHFRDLQLFIDTEAISKVSQVQDHGICISLTAMLDKSL